MHGLILLLFLFSPPVPPIDSSTWHAGIWDTSYRYLGDYTQCLDIITVITPCKWSQLASCCLCGTAGTYSCKKFAFSSILLCKILQSKCCSVSHWVFISPTEIRSGVSNIQGLELSEAMKILYNFHPFLPMRNPSVRVAQCAAGLVSADSRTPAAVRPCRDIFIPSVRAAAVRHPSSCVRAQSRSGGRGDNMWPEPVHSEKYLNTGNIIHKFQDIQKRYQGFENV